MIRSFLSRALDCKVPEASRQEKDRPEEARRKKKEGDIGKRAAGERVKLDRPLGEPVVRGDVSDGLGLGDVEDVDAGKGDGAGEEEPVRH